MELLHRYKWVKHGFGTISSPDRYTFRAKSGTSRCAHPGLVDGRRKQTLQTDLATVLAAGKSLRMGRQKLLLPIGEKPMIAHGAGELLKNPRGQTFVITAKEGHEFSSP